MDINTYMRRELLRERAKLNIAIDRMIDGGLTHKPLYKRLTSEHRDISLALK